MKSYTSPDGYTVYRLESFKDFIDLPEDEIAGALESFEMFIYWMRVTAAAAHPEHREKILEGLPDYLDWKADGYRAVTMMNSDGKPMAEIKIVEVGEGAA